MDNAARIRPAIPDDAHRLCQVRAEAIRRGAREHYTPEQVEAWVARRTPESYRTPIVQGRILVAQKADGDPVGYAQLSLKTGEVEAIYVHPAGMRQGVGTQLLRELERLARAAGLHWLHLDAALNAVRFYEQAGFQQEGEIVYPLEDGGGEYACVYMTKLLL